MKKRLGFVSNSSSSSFIVLANNDMSNKQDFSKFLNPIVGEIVAFPRLGSIYEDDFSLRINDAYYDFDSKVIYAYLLACREDRQDLLDNLEEVIKEGTKAKEIIWNVYLDVNREYKENESKISCEIGMVDDDVEKILEDYDKLYDFIFGIESHIEIESN